MGVKNYLVEGVSGTGKSSVCEELKRRGFRAINGDDELAYQGNPETGESTEGFYHENHIWDVDKVRELVEDKTDKFTFFCGGSRNFYKFIDLFDGTFLLEVDVDTLNERLDKRPENGWGKKISERELILKLHQSKEDIPQDGIIIDATQPLQKVVDNIVDEAIKSTR